MKFFERLKRISSAFVSAASEFTNIGFYSGDNGDTLSGRAYIERDIPRWGNRRKWINRIFFWQEDHCKAAWDEQVNRAIETLNRDAEDKA